MGAYVVRTFFDIFCMCAWLGCSESRQAKQSRPAPPAGAVNRVDITAMNNFKT